MFVLTAQSIHITFTSEQHSCFILLWGDYWKINMFKSYMLVYKLHSLEYAPSHDIMYEHFLLSNNIVFIFKCTSTLYRMYQFVASTQECIMSAKDDSYMLSPDHPQRSQSWESCDRIGNTVYHRQLLGGNCCNFY